MKSACVGVLSIIELKNARWNTEKRWCIYSLALPILNNYHLVYCMRCISHRLSGKIYYDVSKHPLGSRSPPLHSDSPYFTVESRRALNPRRMRASYKITLPPSWTP